MWSKSLISAWVAALTVLLITATATAQTCQTSDDMDPAVKSALISTAQNYFGMASRGDSASLRQNSIQSLASDFGSVETAVGDHKADFAGAQVVPRTAFLLTAEGAAPLERAEFLCGVFGAKGQTANSAEFIIPNLPPGQYGVVILDVSGSSQAHTVSFVLQKQGTIWKLGGFFVNNSQIKGHDGNWFATQARAFKAKGQNHNAWLYLLQARDLLSALPFMATRVTDEIYEESDALKPADLPGENTPVDLSAGGKTYKLIAAYPLQVGKDLDLVVKYQSADVSDTSKTFQENLAVMKALVTKFPELREAFDGIVTRAVEPSGKDWGSMTPMKDIK